MLCYSKVHGRLSPRQAGTLSDRLLPHPGSYTSLDLVSLILSSHLLRECYYDLYVANISMIGYGSISTFLTGSHDFLGVIAFIVFVH